MKLYSNLSKSHALPMCATLQLCIDIILSLNDESSAHEGNKIPLGIDSVATTFLRSESVIYVKSSKRPRPRESGHENLFAMRSKSN